MKHIYYKIKASVSRSYVIAVVSDLHGHIPHEVIAHLQSDKPDVIAVVGDLVDSCLRDNEEIVGLLESCANVSFTALSLGNHDFKLDAEDFDILKRIGVHVYNDSWERYNAEIVIGGLTSPFYHKCEHYDPKVPMAIFPEVEWLNEFEGQDGFKILLDHHPENYEPYTKQRNIDLILSGHNHGGQIRIFGKGVYARNQGLFPKYDGGVYDNRLVVSRGLANTLPIPRLWNPTELVYVDLIPKAIK